jgi:hypothetical protein
MLEDTSMTRRTIELILILTLSVLVAPHVADGQPGRNIPIIGVLRPGYASADARPESGYSPTAAGLNVLRLSEWFLKTARAKTRFTPFARLMADAPAT